MSVVMRIDVVKQKWIILVGVISFFALIIAIIIGAAGPKGYIENSYSAVDCPDGSHRWSSNCKGVDINQNTTWWKRTTPQFSLLNSFWVLQVNPYTLNTNNDVLQEFKIQVSILVKRDVSDQEWINLRVNDTHVATVNCFKGKDLCTEFLLVYEEFIEYPIYEVEVNFPDSQSWLADVEFRLIYVDSAFTQLAMSLRLTFSFINLVVWIVFVGKMKSLPFSEWTWEQKAVAILLLSLLCFNNPLFPFEFAVKGWFFRFFGALLNTIFNCILLIFWLFMIDKIKSDELRLEFNYSHIPKVLVVIIYGVLYLVLFAWISIRDETDPVYGNGILGIQVLYYIVTMLWTGIMIWVGILGGLTIPLAMKKPYLLTRFLFFAIPTGVCIVSVICGIFAGTFGPFGQTGISFVYYLTMFNTWTYVMTWGYFKVKEGFDVPRLITEESPLNFQSQKN